MAKERLLPSKYDTLRTIYEWHEYIYPIIVDPVFANWVHFVAGDVKTLYNKNSHFNNYSDITFSILYDGKKVNAGRFAIGTSDISKSKVDMFLKTIIEFVGYDAYKWALKALSFLRPYIMGIGIDTVDMEKKIYLYYANPIIALKATTYDWEGNLIEEKLYKTDKFNKSIMAFGKRGKRLQINPSFSNKKEMILYISQLDVPEDFKNKAYIAILELGLKIDTVSLSKKRGLAVYFD